MKRQTKLLFISTLSALALLATSFTAKPAQQAPLGTIRGTVVREGTSQPIPNVQISLAEGGPGNQAAGANTANQFITFSPGALVGGDIQALISQLGILTPGNPNPNAKTAITDAAGTFTFPDLAPGSYTVTAQRDGFFGSEVNGVSPNIVRTTVKIADGKPSDVAIAMIPAGTISGKILDPAGAPISNLNVQVLKVIYQNGLPLLQVTSTRATDDRGDYRLFGLPPGEYFVVGSPLFIGAGGGVRGSAGAPPPPPPPPSSPTPDPQARTFFPGVIDLASASRIPLKSGDEVSGINFTMKLAAGGKVTGQVISAIPVAEMTQPQNVGQLINGAAPVPNANLSLVLHDQNVLQDPGTNSNASVSLGAPANGQFEISRVPPGIYDLYASVPYIRGYGPANPPGIATGPVAYGRTTVDLSGGDRTGVTVTVHQGVDIKGRVTIDGKVSPSGNNVRISLQPDGSASKIPVYQQVGRFLPMIEADGTFTIPSVPEAQYRFQVTFGPPAPPLPVPVLRVGPAGAAPAPPPLPAAPAAPAGPPLGPGAYVADIFLGGQSVFDSGLDVDYQSLPALEVVVKTNGASIDGIVHNATQMPAAGATVVLVPQTQHRQNQALYKSSTSDAAGHFAMNGVPPGEYTMFAWENIPPGAYLNAGFLKQYEDRGVSVVVTPGQRLTTSVNLIPRRP